MINRLARPMADTAVLSTAAVAGASHGTNNGSMSSAVMRGLSVLALALALAVPGLATAEIKVAVVDVQGAIGATEEAQAMISALNREYKPQIDELQDIRADIARDQERYQKDVDVLSDSEKRKILAGIEEKRQELQFRAGKLQNAQQTRQQELLSQLLPKLQAVLDDIIELEGYDYVMERRSLLWTNAKHDITRRVTEKLNEAR